MTTTNKRKINRKLFLVLLLAVAITAIVPLSSMASGGAKAEVRFMTGDEVYYETKVEITDNSDEDNGVHYFDSDSYPEDPQMENKIFVGWEYDGHIYKKGDTDQFTIAVGNPIVLKAIFEEEEKNDETESDEKDNSDSRQHNVTTDAAVKEELGGPDTSYPSDDELGNADSADPSTDSNKSNDVTTNSDDTKSADKLTAEDIIAGGQVPTTSIGNTDVPYYSGGLFGSWALVNLVLVIIGGLVAIFTIMNSLLRRKSEKGEILGGDEEYGKTNTDRLPWIVAASVFAMGGILIFILTQDTTSTMVLVDTWTIGNVFLLAASIVSMIFVLKKDKADDSVDI